MYDWILILHDIDWTNHPGPHPNPGQGASKVATNWLDDNGTNHHKRSSNTASFSFKPNSQKVL